MTALHSGGFVIRADASNQSGSGHVMRCISLGQQVRRRGLPLLFCCVNVPGHLGHTLEQAGFDCALLPPIDSKNDQKQALDAQATHEAWLAHGMRPSWVIVDHYDLGLTWHQCIRGLGPQLAVLDDLADRLMDCEVLINQNATPQLHQRYSSLLGRANALMLLGTDYTLLREEFAETAQKIADVDSPVMPTGLIVFLGGADNENLTVRVLEQISQAHYRGPVHVLLGEMNPNRATVKAWCDVRGLVCELANPDINAKLVNTRVAVVACGMFAVELQALGIPCVLVPLSGIQDTVAQHFVRCGNALMLSPSQLLEGETLAPLLAQLLARPLAGTRKPSVAMDGASRVIQRLLEFNP